MPSRADHLAFTLEEDGIIVTSMGEPFLVRWPLVGDFLSKQGVKVVSPGPATETEALKLEVQILESLLRALPRHECLTIAQQLRNEMNERGHGAAGTVAAIRIAGRDAASG